MRTITKPSLSPYTIENNDLLLDGDGKRYVLKVRDLPSEEKPREKLLAVGPANLSTQELLAIVLSSGTRKEEVMSMAARITADYGDRNVLSSLDANKLSEDLDIPIVKAMQLVACGELGRRFNRTTRDGAPVIRTAKDVFEHVVDMRNLKKEHLRGLYLNTHYQVIHDEVISIGTVDANMVHPREVFRPAISYGAAAVILVHNHPSGVLVPSDADRAVTRQIAEGGKMLGIDVIDHVIVTDTAFTSVALD